MDNKNTLIEYCQSLKHNIILNDVTLLPGREVVDIFFPDDNVAVVYHNLADKNLQTLQTKYSKNDAKTFHQQNSIILEGIGIRLIHVWQHHWDNDDHRRNTLKNIIANAVHEIHNKIFARKCEIVHYDLSTCSKIDKRIIIDFFDTNNINYHKGARYAVALKYNDEIVHAFSFGHAFWGKGKYQYELIRGASKLHHTIVGGSSKLWKAFKTKFNPDSVVYYTDYSYFSGNSMFALQDFKFVEITSPGIWNWWLEENIVKNREPMRHKMIMELEKQGKIKPLYNCGTKLFVYRK